MKTIDQLIEQAQPVIPIMVIDHLDQVLPMARALAKGGITVFEITLRTACALDAIARLKQEMPNCLVGAGTVINSEQFRQVAAIGGDFVVSPGLSDDLLGMATETGLPFLPGVSSPSDVIKALNAGFQVQKFFPAEQSGGAGMLKALSGPFGQVRFCPTGGIGMHNVSDYLAQPNVVCVGSSWVLPKAMVTERDWAGITRLALEASKLT